MSSDTVALVVSTVGVVGTLASAVITQAIAVRSRREEMVFTDQQRQREWRRDATDEAFKDRRACYVGLNAASRQFVTEMNNFLHRLREGNITAEDVADLDAAKNVHRDRYSESQMIATDAVLPVARKTNQALNRAYGAARRLRRQLVGADIEAGVESSIESALAENHVLWDHIYDQRQAMREDLQVSGFRIDVP